MGLTVRGDVLMGLLLPHKRTVTVYPDMVSFSENVNRNGGNNGKRGKITIFSAESRYRLFRLFHGLQFKRWTFCTLTYGATFPDDPRVCKVHLKAYRRAFERRYGKIPGVWRMELQERGAYHFHILYLDPPFIPIREWNDLWDRCSCRLDEEKFGNSVDIEIGWRQADSDVVSKYLGKYIGKQDDRLTDGEETSCGRWWGKWNIEEPEPIKVELYPADAIKLARSILPSPESGEWMPSSIDNFTYFGKSMGTDKFRDKVMNLLGEYLTPQNSENCRKVTFVTRNIE